MKTIQFKGNRWVKVALLNFFIVALTGVILRYKINFSLPFINHKFLLHGHSHFAFVGWISLALMTFMVNHLIKNGVSTNYRKYHWLLLTNTLCAYGMLFSFTLQGYAFFSIGFSSLTILLSYVFTYNYVQDLKKIKSAAHIGIWFKTALFLWLLSSLGTFALAYLMASATLIQEFYFAAIYFFLHFQYNGYFIFGCFALLFSLLKDKHPTLSRKNSKALFLILALTVIPSYILSTFALEIPHVLFWIGMVAAIVQLIALYYSYKLFLEIHKHLKKQFTKMTCFLWSLSYLAFTLKIVLQALSALPYFRSFAFSYKPVIIGYLHLCFLAMISFFILGLINEYLKESGLKLNWLGLSIFITGVIVQEVILMLQTLEAMMSRSSNSTNMILFLAAIAMAIGLALLMQLQRIKKTI